MSPGLLNVLLALAWLALTGDFRPSNLFLGLIIGYVLLWYCGPFMRPTRYFRKTRLALAFFAFYLWDLTKSNLRVAFEVITPRHRMRPGVVAVPLDARTDAEITLLSNLITMTPGTLSLDVSTDRRVIYVHAMHIRDAESVRRQIKDGLERRVLELLR